MIFFWLNNAFCLRPENDEEFECLKMLYYSFKKGINIDPNHDPDNRIGYTGEDNKSLQSSGDLSIGREFDADEK